MAFLNFFPNFMISQTSIINIAKKMKLNALFRITMSPSKNNPKPKSEFKIPDPSLS